MRKKSAARPQQKSWIENHFDFIFYSILTYAALLDSFLNSRSSTGMFNDDAVYVLGARDLLGHAPIHSLILKPDYPLPGIPLLLSPLARLVEPDWTVLEWVSVLVTLLLIYVLGKWVRTWFSAGEALAVVALFAFNPLLSKLSGVIMPTPYYTMAVIGSLLLMRRQLDNPTPAGSIALGVLMGWGSLIRPEGILLLVSVAGAMSLTQKGRKILGPVLVPIAFWALFVLYWFHYRRYSGSEYGSDVSALLSFWTQHPISAIAFTGEFLNTFLIKAVTGYSLPAMWFSFPVYMVCLGLIISGFLSIWRQYPDHRSELIAMGAFGILYSLVHLFWHVAVGRYALPLIPFILVFSVRGLSDILSRLRLPRIWTGISLGLVLMICAVNDGQAVYESIWEQDPMKSPPWESLEWLNRNTPADAKVLSFIAPSIELYANRPALTGIKAFNLDMFLYLLKHYQLSYIVDRNVYSLTPGIGGAEDINRIWKRMRLWITHYPEHFRPVFSNPNEQTTIYEVVNNSEATEDYDQYRSAATNYLEGHEEESFHILEHLLAHDPDLGTAENLIGGIYLRRSDFKHAENAFLRAIQLLPDSPIAMINLASLYRLEGRTPLSDNYIRKALQVSDINGDSELLKTRLLGLFHLWDQHQAMIFMDPL